ncbi:SCO family protein [Lysobacter sp. LF1]|uniref:SCO family protein n=1 Tax=Lysobacter stagni TaxID=3045172 RepID=A0ABT6XIF7_9GAMM|nr:SCO family protein [Lysobacter sp. LF1]MDI9239939.1 SCO family protein [Lysobacter sp. LF1]
MKRMFKRFFLGLALCALAVPALAGEAAALPGDSVYQVQSSLTDQDGRTVAWQDLRGRPAVVSMFYANCHLMCPLIVASGKALQKRLTPQEYAGLDLAMLSIDPARDTPAALREVATTHQLDLDRWHLLRPSDGDVRTLAAALGVRYRAQPDGTFNHTSVLILLDREGRIVARSEVTGLQPDAAFVDKVRETLAAAP